MEDLVYRVEPDHGEGEEETGQLLHQASHVIHVIDVADRGEAESV